MLRWPMEADTPKKSLKRGPKFRERTASNVCRLCRNNLRQKFGDFSIINYDRKCFLSRGLAEDVKVLHSLNSVNISVWTLRSQQHHLNLSAMSVGEKCKMLWLTQIASLCSPKERSERCVASDRSSPLGEISIKCNFTVTSVKYS